MLEPWLVWAFVGFAGACVGSFLNVVVVRCASESGMSLFFPARSVCPPCGRVIRPRDNLPALSFVLLRGRCRDCRAVIPWMYPLVEVLGAAVTILSVWRFGFSWGALAASAFGWTLVLIAACDWRDHLIPWRFPLGGALLLIAWAAYIGGTALGVTAFLDGVLMAATLAGVAIIVGWVIDRPFGSERSVMGEADVAVTLFLGAGLGFGQAVMAVSYGALLGLIVFGVRAVPVPWRTVVAMGYGAVFLCGVFLGGDVFLAVQVLLVLAVLPAKKMDQGSGAIPFGALMCAGAVLVLIWPEPLAALIQGWLPWHSDWVPSRLFT